MSNVYSSGYTVPYHGNQQLWRHRQQMAKEKYIIKRHELTTNVRHNIKPPLHDATPDQLAMARGIYGVRLKPIPKQMSVYDRIFKTPPDWDPRVKKDSHRYLRQYKVNARTDEDNREIPVMANCEIGHRLWARPEPFKREYARVRVYHHSTYRPNGVSIGKEHIF